MEHIAPPEERQRYAFEQRMLNIWFGKDTRLYTDYCRQFPTGEAMLNAIKRDRPRFYNQLKAEAEAQLIYLGRKPE